VVSAGGLVVVWMNGDRVGEWGTVRRGGSPFFRYDRSWVESRRARALSLSLPPDCESRDPRSAGGVNYFDNLLPDNPAIRSRIRSRFNIDSTATFDLLTRLDAIAWVPSNSTAGQEPVVGTASTPLRSARRS